MIGRRESAHRGSSLERSPESARTDAEVESANRRLHFAPSADCEVSRALAITPYPVGPISVSRRVARRRPHHELGREHASLPVAAERPDAAATLDVVQARGSVATKEVVTRTRADFRAATSLSSFRSSSTPRNCANATHTSASPASPSTRRTADRSEGPGAVYVATAVTSCPSRLRSRLGP